MPAGHSPATRLGSLLRLQQALVPVSRPERQVWVCLRRNSSSNVHESQRLPNRQASARLRKLTSKLQAHRGGEARHCTDRLVSNSQQ